MTFCRNIEMTKNVLPKIEITKRRYDVTTSLVLKQQTHQTYAHWQHCCANGRTNVLILCDSRTMLPANRTHYPHAKLDASGSVFTLFGLQSYAFSAKLPCFSAKKCNIFSF